MEIWGEREGARGEERGESEREGEELEIDRERGVRERVREGWGWGKRAWREGGGDEGEGRRWGGERVTEMDGEGGRERGRGEREVTFIYFLLCLGVRVARVRSGPEGEHFPHQYSKAPHVRRRCVGSCNTAICHSIVGATGPYWLIVNTTQVTCRHSTGQHHTSYVSTTQVTGQQYTSHMSAPYKSHVSTTQVTCQHHTSTSDLLFVPRVETNTGIRAFLTVAPTLWNSLR